MVHAVVAGPGCGKTTRLVAEACRHVDEGGRVVVFTFSNRAAENAAGKLSSMLGTREYERRVWCGTVHSFCLESLRAWGAEVEVIPEDGMERVFEAALAARIDADTDVASALNAPLLRALLTRARMGRVIEAASALEPAWRDGLEDLARTWEARRGAPTDSFLARDALVELHARVTDEGALSFDDTCVAAVELLARSARTGAAAVAEPPFGDVTMYLVDEFQDSDPLQFVLFLVLARVSGVRLFVIGDPRQAIYSFRGGMSDAFERLLSFHPDTKVEKLSLSYRCPSSVLEAAEAAVSSACGDGRFAPPLRGVEETDRGECGPWLWKLDDEHEEALAVAALVGWLCGREQFVEVHGGGLEEAFAYDEICILGRTRDVLSPVAAALPRSYIPFVFKGGSSSKDVLSDALALFASMCGCMDSEELKRALMLEAGGRRKLRGALASLEPASLAAAYCGSAAGSGLLPPEIRGFAAECREKWAASLPLDDAGDIDAAGCWRGAASRVGGLPSQEMERIAFLLDSYKGRLGSGMKAADRLMEEAREGLLDTGRGGVVLSTMHAAKGLEFPVVIVVGLEDGLLPLSIPGTDELEERRLLYVAFTRASRRLYCTFASRRGGGSRRLSPFVPAERFDRSMPESVMERIRARRRRREQGRQLTLFGR